MTTLTELLKDPTISYTISYAQNREDLIIAGFLGLKSKGFYVDVGANHPLNDSVTKIFYDHKWSGINIEPIRAHYKDLQKRRPRDINLNIGVASKSGSLTLREYAGTGLSTFSEAMKQEHEAQPESTTRKFHDYEVPVKELKDIFADYKVEQIDFMKVDVEGYEYDVLVSNDWDKYRPKLICIEANHIEKDWRPLLKKHNYMLEFFDGLNEYYVDKFARDVHKFSYVDSVVSKQPIITYQLQRLLDQKISEKISALVEDVYTSGQRIAALEYHRDLLIKEVEKLQNQGLKHHLKQLPHKLSNSLDERLRKDTRK